MSSVMQGHRYAHPFAPDGHLQQVENKCFTCRPSIAVPCHFPIIIFVSQVIAMHIQLASDGHSEQSVYTVASAGGVAGAPPRVHLLPDTEASRCAAWSI